MEQELVRQNQDNAGQICHKIQVDSQAQAADVADMARQEVSRILDEASEEARAAGIEFSRQTDNDIERLKELVFSTLNLEKRKVVLGAKNSFADDVLNLIHQKAAAFRNAEGYRDYLTRLISVGAQVVDSKDVTVIYSCLDQNLFEAGFINRIKNACLGCDVNFQKGEFKDIGLMVQSRDGRRIYDGCFNSIISGLAERLREELLGVL